MIRTLGLSVFGLLALVVGFNWFTELRSGAGRVAPEVIAQAPSFSLTDVNGLPFNSEQLKGSVWLANFFFSSCGGPCPKINGELRRLADNPDLKGLRVISITVDPERDTPARLKEYSAKYAAKPGAWDFLTGSGDEIRAVIERGFQLIAPEDVSMHTTRIVLVDRAGGVRGLYQGTEQESLKQLFADVGLLVRSEM